MTQTRLKSYLAVFIALLMALTTIVPVSAARIYNRDTNTWEEVGERPAGTTPRYTAIRPQVVDYQTTLPVGSIVVETGERRLYLVLEGGKAMRYGVGVGREGFTWAGSNRITRMAEWPGWTPPPAMRRRVPGLPAHMPGGIDNPLGARALYIGSTLYRIHGSNEPWTIGQAVSSGCIRMTNDDVVDLYNRVRVGARVVVRH